MYFWADSSPQGRRDWFLAAVDCISSASLREVSGGVRSARARVDSPGQFLLVRRVYLRAAGAAAFLDIP
eukprot:9620231-Alexandrium_andersonii.AAC.1